MGFRSGVVHVGLDVIYINHAKNIIKATPREATTIRWRSRGSRLGFEPDELQCEVVRSTSRRGMLSCARQWGKTTVSAARAVHRVYTQPGSLVVAASPGGRQSGIWMERAEEMMRRLG